MWSGINRRKFPRVNYNCLINIEKPGSPETISTRTENIGEGGICVILYQDLGLFNGVNIEIKLDNGISSPLKCNGTVVWVVKKRGNTQDEDVTYDTGIEFIDLKDNDKMRIQNIVDKQLNA